MNFITVSEYYKKQCNNKAWYDKFYKNEDGYYGTIFNFLGTNYRTINQFEYYFVNFKNYIDLPRNLWPVKETTGQEIAKQYTANLTSTELYISRRNLEGELIYQLTKKGETFNEMLTLNFTEYELKILIFLLILNGSFRRIPRYILKKTEKVLTSLEENNLKIEDLISDIKQFLVETKHNTTVKHIFDYDCVWYLTFYADDVFIDLFNIASPEDKKVLKERTKSAYSAKDKTNVLSWKYKGTNNSRWTTWDNFLMIYLTHYIEKFSIDKYDYEIFFDNILIKYNEIRPINITKITNYIKANKSVFKVIFNSVISKEDDYTEVYIHDYKPRELDNLYIEESSKIDSTSEEGIYKLNVIREVYKKMAKQQSNYKCALESINMCNYFTSKEEEKNYLEIHHFIPREFSYEFEDTIEVLENYVPLCPRCHTMIHRATDRERIGLINFLYSTKNDKLREKKLDIELETIYEYYGIQKKESSRNKI